MATRKIDPEEIPAVHNPGIPPGVNRTPRVEDIKAFLKSGDAAHEVIIQPGEKPDHVYTALHNSIRCAGAEELIRVTRRFERIFLIRRDAPFSATGQTKFKG